MHCRPYIHVFLGPLNHSGSIPGFLTSRFPPECRRSCRPPSSAMCSVAPQVIVVMIFSHRHPGFNVISEFVILFKIINMPIDPVTIPHLIASDLLAVPDLIASDLLTYFPRPHGLRFNFTQCPWPDSLRSFWSSVYFGSVQYNCSTIIPHWST